MRSARHVVLLAWSRPRARAHATVLGANYRSSPCSRKGAAVTAYARSPASTAAPFRACRGGFGQGCVNLHNRLVSNLKCPFVAVDEQHAFCLVKQDHRRLEHPAYAGDIWTWSAQDRESRLIVSFQVWKRTAWWTRRRSPACRCSAAPSASTTSRPPVASWDATCWTQASRLS